VCLASGSWVDGGILSEIRRVLTRYSANDRRFPVNDRGSKFVSRAAVNPSLEAADKTSMFCTPRETNFDPLEVRDTRLDVRYCVMAVPSEKRRGRPQIVGYYYLLLRPLRYSALRATPLALLGAALKGVWRRFVSPIVGVGRQYH
jgi:hypothetical protein